MAEIPKIVSRRLHAIAATESHPDPNLLGAFVEKALAMPERVQVLQHLSRCKNCREIVSLTAAQPGIADVVSVVPVRAGWRTWPVLRWGVAVACLVVVGAVVTFHPQGSRRIAASISEGKPGSQLSVSTPAKNADDASPAATPVEIADAGAGAHLHEMVPGRAKPAESHGAEKEIGGSDDIAAPASAANAAVIPLVSTNTAPRWTLSADGALQRSRDSGRTWQSVPVPSQTKLRALAANGLNIWVGGEAGALYHSSDSGRHWTQVRPVVNGEALTADIIGVEFPDALHGKLTLSDPAAQAVNRNWQPGQTLPQYNFPADSSAENVEVQKTPAPALFHEQTWTTADAGQTWQKQ
jgi:hypothetical protein